MPASAPTLPRRSLILLLALSLLVLLLQVTAASADEHGQCGDAYTPIYEIQGDGTVSPFAGSPPWFEGDPVVTEGVVTHVQQALGTISGYFIQDPSGDGDPSTSDGLFVYDFRDDVEIGDHVRVMGGIEENRGLTRMDWTDELTVCDSGVEVAPVTVTAPEYTNDTERFEGMYIQFEKKLVVTDLFNFYRYGEIWVTEGGVSEQPTNEFAPGADADALAASNMERSLMIDDGWTWQFIDPPPLLDPEPYIRLGHLLEDYEAVVWYAFGDYRAIPVGNPEFINANPRKDAPKVGGRLTVASLNVLNYFTTLEERGAESEEQLAAQTEKLVSQLLAMDADILALQEIENDPTHTPILTLLEALNAVDEAGDWMWIGEPIDLETKVVHYNNYPIRNEILYRSGSVTPLGSATTIADLAFDAIREGDDPGDEIGRPPVAQVFEANGEIFTVVVSHLKSKGSSCDVEPTNDPDLDDGQSNCNLTRVTQAERTLEFVDDLVEESGDPDVLVVGDLNSYFREDPVVVLEEELENLLDKYDNDPYTYNFFAPFAAPWIGRGALDHALATPSLARQVTTTKVWHVNADEAPTAWWWSDWDSFLTPENPFRASDHDPVLIGLSLNPGKGKSRGL